MIPLRPRSVPWVVGAAALLAACSSPPPAAEPEVRAAQVGDPLPGLSPQELARFEAGKAAFSRVFLQEEGLGPTFNENSCNACHSSPGIGGSGGEEYDIHATFQSGDGKCDLLDDGKAPTLWEAIARHGGEGTASVEAFNALPELRRHALVAFLLTL